MENTFEKRKKMVYDFICDDLYVPMKIKEMAMVLQITREQRDELKEVLDALEAEGKISLSKRGKYSKGQAQKLTGIFQAHARGFGFIVREGVEDDVYIPEEDTQGAFQGDEVEFIITRKKDAQGSSGRRMEGKITRILSRGTTQIVGLYEKCKSYGFVRPDDPRMQQDVYIPEGKEKGAMTGHKVVVKLTSYGEEQKKPEGIVEEIIGHINDPGTDILSIVKGFALPTEFPEKVMNQAERVSKEVSPADREGRKDLRTWQMVTIDGEDAKDLDDAVSLTKEGENYHLGVHIADVTNYVQENSALDREALKRGTSVYLVDRVIPMLPHKLSNGICSLNAGEDRLALSCLMTINPKGEVIDSEIAETVICVDERMSYTSVARILEERDPQECQRYAPLLPLFERMAELSGILRERRKKRGSIDFDFPETKMVLDAQGRPVEIKPYERNVATKLIEDFMLLVKALCLFINNFGYHMHVGNEVRSKEIQKLLGKVDGTPEEALISRLALRSMKQAKYTPENTGHFGLAAKYYTHFTSPIRRYPDLQIHRIIKENIRGRMNEERIAHYEKILTEVAMQSSMMERRAEEAERETVRLKKVEYMKERIGEEFEGVISGITRWGAYVELPNTIEGMVHVTNMWDDHYDYVEERYELIGEQTRKVYQLGQAVKIRVIAADRIQRTIDFEFCEEP